MIAGIPAKNVLRAALAAGFVGLSILLVSGCEDRYPDSLDYPIRSDPLVIEVPTDPAVQPKQFDLPGTLALLIEQVKEKKGKTLSPADLDSKQRDEFERTLTKLFGTPAHPKVDGIDENVRTVLKLDETTLTQGSQLYRRHCLHCHGLPGDGRGPTATWVNPHPRDYRRGIFKFTSTSGGNDRKPRREDLARTLRHGIEGTSMPTFDLLPQNEIDALVSYVIHLSLRGQVEYETMKGVLGNKESPNFQLGTSIETELTLLTGFYAGDRWLASASEIIKPDEYQEPNEQQFQESLRRGHLIFKQDGCLGCHLNYGRKDNFLYDDWGTIVRAQNLTLGTYRGGRRPVDLYWRMYAGINGSKMPAVYEPLKQQNKKLWDLVNFVLALPYPRMLPEDIRTEIYGAP